MVVKAMPKQMSLGSIPEARHAQAMDALQYANEVRTRRCRILKSLSRGEVTVAEVLDNEWCQTATIFNVLRHQHRWGRARVHRLLTRTGVPEGKQIRFLTQRQRAAILTDLRLVREGKRSR